MTECERIIKEKPEWKNFLAKEIRNDYTVTTDLKKVWLIEIDLLQRLLELCNNHGLQLWMMFGTMLGAVRHNGYVPWDDDIDVCLSRDDYDILIRIANSELEEPYFMQTTLNDTEYYSSFARIRNSNTTGILVSPNSSCNNGIYIDIWPIDGIDTNGFAQFIRSKWVKIQNTLAHAYTFNVNPHPLTRLASRVLRMRWVHYNHKKVFKNVDQLAKKVSWEDTDKVGFVVYTPYSYKQSVFLKRDFEETVWIPFEGFKVPVPCGYKNILTKIYGDYMSLPPVEQRGEWHSFMFEPDIPYREYMKKY